MIDSSLSNPLYIAVSGGIDSMVLLHYLLYGRSEYSQSETISPRVKEYSQSETISPRVKELPFDSLVVLNYPYPDTHSQECLSFLKHFLSLPHPLPLSFLYPDTHSQVEVGEVSGIGLEDQWRRERYRFFDKVVPEGGTLALAHHWDDNKVSFIINTLKGSERGFIPPVSLRNEGKYKVIRPLHLCPKQDIRKYQEVYQVPYLEDPTNRNSQRGKIEHILPLLEANIHQMPGALRNKYLHYLKQYKPLWTIDLNPYEPT